MKIRIARTEDQSAWDDYVQGHPDGLAYHQFAWKKAVEGSYGLNGRYLVAEERNSICGILPMVDFNLPSIRRTLVSLPYCDVGGCLADTPEIRAALLEEACLTAKRRGAKGVELRYGEEPGCEGFRQAMHKVRMVLDLPDSSDALLLTFNAKLRSQVKKPMRDGLTVKLGGDELVETFYRVFSWKMRELGSPVHSKKWFHRVVSDFATRAKVGVVYTPDGCPAAAGIILLHAKTVSIPWASSLRHLNRLNPNMYLYWSFLAFASDNGFKAFDFGRSTPGEGTYHFKEQWGAKPKSIYWIGYDQNGNFVAHKPKDSKLRTVAENFWRHMPLEFCNSIGPLLRRHISL